MQVGSRTLCTESPRCLRALMLLRRQVCAHQKLSEPVQRVQY
jgi:hypothetical protein